MSESEEEFDDATLWETELEIALLTKCDYGTIRNISKLRPIPDSLRSKVWKICLDVQEDIENNAISKWQEVYDLPQQQKIREDCQILAEKLHPEDKEQQLAAVSQLESIITYHCKINDENYEKDNGWLELLYPILTLNLTKNECYNFFNAILRRYIPKDCVQNGSPYHLFRLLMLYHDPELCAFLDTKKISPDSYAHFWFRSLFASKASVKVTLNIWDMYFQLGDQFLIFFMSLILVFNGREETMSSNNVGKSELTKTIQHSPSTVNIEDLQDFNALCQHFAAKTPQSFRKEYKKPLFEGVSLEKKACKIYQALCLPVSVDELLQANQLGSGVRYFIIDCRPAEQYNASHYATAFHLDANLMLENPSEFNQSVEALLAAQKQAINSGSVAGGQHLCFMGSGHDDEDKYVNMVVSNFLQRKINFVSLALGGYEELKRSAEDPEMIVGNEVSNLNNPRAKFTEDWVKKINTSESMLNKFSNVFKSRSSDIKDKLKDYIGTSLTTTTSLVKKESANLMGDLLTQKLEYSNMFWSSSSNSSANNKEKHVSSSDKIGKLYRNQGNLFAIDDTNDDETMSDRDSKEHEIECVNLKVWLEKPDTLKNFKCFYREKNESKKNEWIPGHLLLTKTHLYGLTQRKHRKNGMVEITVRHPLSSIIKIATKSSCPEIISFTIGEKIEKTTKSNKTTSDITSSIENLKLIKESETASVATSSSTRADNDDNEYIIRAKEWFYIPDYAGEAASAVKLQILQIIELIA